MRVNVVLNCLGLELRLRGGVRAGRQRAAIRAGCRVEVGAVGPDDCPYFRVQADLVEVIQAAKRRVHLAMQYRLKVDGLFGVIAEMNTQRIRFHHCRRCYIIRNVARRRSSVAVQCMMHIVRVVRQVNGFRSTPFVLPSAHARLDRSRQRRCDQRERTTMALRGAQILQFQEALLSAYDGPGLAQMVRIRLDEDLAAVAGGGNLSEVVFNLILWAERTGRTEELVVGASASNPQNALLKTFTSQYLASAGGQAGSGRGRVRRVQARRAGRARRSTQGAARILAGMCRRAGARLWGATRLSRGIRNEISRPTG